MSIERLLNIMALLRDPQRGCPWDLEQDFRSVAPYTIEEAYEVVDAIERNDLQGLREELGDLLFQIVFHAQIAQEQGIFGFEEVVAGICEKMQRRHPHVFGNERIDTVAQQNLAWEQIKQRERAPRGGHSASGVADGSGSDAASLLSDVPLALPSLTRAAKLGRRAAQAGFQWPDVAGALDKLDEEIAEMRAELARGADPEAIAAEIGDVLFCLVNVCRYLQIDPETSLRGTNAKFERRFRHVERRLRERGRSLQDASLEEMDALWEEGKRLGH
ncbi:nucleoside triphosphate hydrolase [Steroidobacter denitrificans]|uniref:Nucleoside triphosphate pyrophosphohydrolase n=1 Tax=Steroidobacter denitrificans TaxID=465721 RepID=A0A127F9I3_STEDE|nr:nucleoside triphosphate pyrophosphohydrolase [Steroidobacter denitrificans]AMN47072.1 nucleoside triphosphate hydrolase [Steroidobacter denitrificans]